MQHDYLDWPFFDARHGVLARELDAWASANLADAHGADVDAVCRALVARLGRWRTGSYTVTLSPAVYPPDTDPVIVASW